VAELNTEQVDALDHARTVVLIPGGILAAWPLPTLLYLSGLALMAVMYCELCERLVEPRRRIGGWTHFVGLLSLGLSYLAVPFYRRRCPICTSAAVTRVVPGDLARKTKRLPVSELEDRLALTTDELDATAAELDRVRAERDFYRDLSGEERRGKQE
jgi:hypothetical protein